MLAAAGTMLAAAGTLLAAAGTLLAAAPGHGTLLVAGCSEFIGSAVFSAE